MEDGKASWWRRSLPPRTSRRRGSLRYRLHRQHPADAQSCPMAPSRCWSRRSVPHRRCRGHAQPVRRQRPPVPVAEAEHEIEAMRRAIIAQFDQYVKLNKKIPPEILTRSGIDRRTRAPGRHHRRAPAAQARAEAGSARDVRRPAERASKTARPARRSSTSSGRKAHPWPRQAPDGEEPARVLPERAGQGHPEGTRRRRRRRRPRELDKKIKSAGMPKEARKRPGRAEEAAPDVADVAEATVVRNYIDWSACRGRRSRASARTWPMPKGLDRRSLRPGEGQGTHPRIPRRAAARPDKVKAPILCLVGPPGVAKPRSASRSPRPPTASSSAWRSAACATRPRSAATAAPTSARCRARSCRT